MWTLSLGHLSKGVLENFTKHNPKGPKHGEVK